MGVNAIADALTPDARNNLLTALRKMAAQVSIPALTTAIKNGDVSAALKAINAVQFPQHLKPLAQNINQGFSAAAQETIKPFVKVDPTFTIKNELAQAAADFSGQKITQITDETRTAVRKLIRKGLTDGIEPKRLATEIKPLIGLNARQALAVQNARAAWTKSGLDADSVEKQAAKYTERLRKQRALTIARTEMIGASNRGQLHGWRAGAKAGYLNPNIVKRKWIATPKSTRTCPICQGMHGQEVNGLQEMFAGPKGQIQHPPIHPNCRCTVALIVPKSTATLKLPTPQPITDTFSTPVPMEPHVPVVMPEEKDYVQAAKAQQAALDAAVAAKKAKTQAYNKQYNAMYRAKKKLEKQQAKKTVAQASEDLFSWDEFKRADAVLDVRSEDRVNAKVDIMGALSKRLANETATVYRFGADRALRDLSQMERDQWVRDRISTWAATSGDSDADAIAMQLAVRDQFNLADADVAHFAPGMMEQAQYTYNRDGAAMRALAREMHAHTQDWFQQRGITHVTLVRGARYKTEIPVGWGNFQLQPASSFSTDIDVSFGFGDTMHVIRVPVNQILGTARTGFGCLTEHEYVVLGGRLRGWTQNASNFALGTEKYPISQNAYSFTKEIEAVIKAGNPVTPDPATLAHKK